MGKLLIMLSVKETNRFKKDIKKLSKQQLNLKELAIVVDMLRKNKKLPSQYLDHHLIGDYRSCRECHIKPDWLLIYQIEDDILTLVRTGTHSELFK